MSRGTLFTIACILLLGILLAYASGLVFRFFWSLWWYDVLLHFIGGISLGLLFGSLTVVRRDTLRRVVYKVFTPVLLAAVLWEYVEFQRQVFFASDYVTDTISDLALGLAGALIAVLVVHISPTRNV